MPACPPGTARKIRVYGPVPSRRLGFSLGVDLLPFKTCSMDCVYCQLGTGARTTVRRRAFVPVDDILAQIKSALARKKPVDAITFSGSGEPTLHSGLGRIIAGIRRMTDVKIVLLTNSAGLTGTRARRDAAGADIVVPSLDAATAGVFARINRPHPGLTVEKIIAGLAAFRKEFKGQIWLEIMLIQGLNDSPAHLRALKKAVARIRPDRVQLNTAVRPPAESWVRPLSPEALEAARRMLGGNAEIIADFSRARRAASVSDPGEAIAATLARRPMTAADLAASLGLPLEEVLAQMRRLEFSGRVRSAVHSGRVFFEPRR
jgi:wyosine [tRNA(Phe)-imidazoG37] synthetase (radical SAM superfamily)